MQRYEKKENCTPFFAKKSAPALKKMFTGNGGATTQELYERYKRYERYYRY